MPEKFVFFRNYAVCLEGLPDDMQGRILMSLCRYVLDEKEPELDGAERAIFQALRPSLDSAIERAKRNEANGKQHKCEAKGNPDATQTEPKGNPDRTQTAGIKNKEQGMKNKETSSLSSDKPDNTAEKARLKSVCDDVIAELNAVCGTTYKPTTKKTVQCISARLRDGYELSDFLTVIHKKADEWRDTEQERYLRPETLFGTKFESYLNQRICTSKPKMSDRARQQAQLLDEIRADMFGPSDVVEADCIQITESQNLVERR